MVVEGPYGMMNAARRRHRDVLLIAAGVGVTTMRGLAEAVLAEPAVDGASGLPPAVRGAAAPYPAARPTRCSCRSSADWPPAAG